MTWVRRNEDTIKLNFHRLAGHDDVLLGLASVTGRQRAQLWISSDRGAGWAPIEPSSDPLKPVVVDHLHDFIQGRFVVTATGGRWFESPTARTGRRSTCWARPEPSRRTSWSSTPFSTTTGGSWPGACSMATCWLPPDNAKTWKDAGGLEGSFLTFGNNVYVADPGVHAGACPHFTTDPLEKDDWQPISWTGSTRPTFRAVAFGLPQVGP